MTKPTETLQERVDKALGWKDVSRRAASRAIGNSDNALNAMFSRKGKPSAATITPLADYLNVRVDWLLTGKGHPYPLPDTLPEDEKYPSRPLALAIAQIEGFSAETIAEVAGMSHFAKDPGPFRWVDILRGIEAKKPSS